MPPKQLTDTLAMLTLTAISAIIFGGPVTDIDFWWHIANGRWIWENQGLPTADPFNIYPDINFWAHTILQGQWGGQVLLYLVFETAGAPGIIALRVLALGATLALADWRLRQLHTSPVARWASLLTIAIVLSGFTAERPQLFSILLFSLTVVLMEIASARARVQWLIIPLLMVWTNLHQGVLLGALVATAWAILLAYEEWKRDRGTFPSSRLLFALAALVTPLFTPNGLRGIQYLVWLEFEPAKQRISEYLSPLAYLGKLLQFPHLVVFFGFVAALGVTLVISARSRPRESALVALLLAASLSTYRYIPFVLIMGMPLVASTLPGFLARRQLGRLALGVFAFLLAAGSLKVLIHSLESLGTGISRQAYPVDLVTEAKRQGIAGRVFNTVGWGGYLTWELQGRVLPYIDGRYLMNTRRLDDYTHILWATGRGIAKFENERFDWVVIPHRNVLAPTAPPYPLIAFLRHHPEWEARLVTAQGALFSRKTAPPGH